MEYQQQARPGLPPDVDVEVGQAGGAGRAAPAAAARARPAPVPVENVNPTGGGAGVVRLSMEYRDFNWARLCLQTIVEISKMN